MKVAVRGLAREHVLPLLWAHGLEDDEGGEPDVVLGSEAEQPRVGDPPRVVWTGGPWVMRATWPAALVCAPPRVTPPEVREPGADAPLAEVLAAMRQAYVQQLPTALAELVRAVIDARRGVVPVPDARMLAHRMRGTAGTYGQAGVGVAAGRLEDQLVAGELAWERLAGSLTDLASAVVVAAGPDVSWTEARVLVVGAAPAGPPGMFVRVPDLAAAERAAMTGEGQALWVSGEVAGLVEHPGLWDIPVAVVRDDSPAVAAVAWACLRPGPWGRLFGP